MEDLHKNLLYLVVEAYLQSQQTYLVAVVQGVSTSICLSCMEIGAGVLGFEVSMTAEMLLSEGILLATGVVTGVCGTVVGFTGVSSSGVVDMAGCSGVLHIP